MLGMEINVWMPDSTKKYCCNTLIVLLVEYLVIFATACRVLVFGKEINK